MRDLQRITMDPAVMSGKACIRGTRVTVGTIMGLLSSGHSPDDIVAAYPYLGLEDITESLAYATWIMEAREVSLPS